MSATGVARSQQRSKLHTYQRRMPGRTCSATSCRPTTAASTSAPRIPPLIATLSRPRACERAQALDAAVRRPDDGKAVDEIVGQRAGLARIAARVGAHVVVAAQRLEHGAVARRYRPVGLAVHHREAREGREPAAHQAARRRHVAVATQIDVGPEGDAVGIEACRLAGLPRQRDAPRQPFDVGAQGEHHPFGMQRRQGDHLGAAGGDLDRHLGAAGDPGDAARRRRVVQFQRRHRRRHVRSGCRSPRSPPIRRADKSAAAAGSARTAPAGPAPGRDGQALNRRGRCPARRGRSRRD